MRDLGIHTEVGMLGSWREGSHILFNSEIRKQFLVHYQHMCIDKSLLKIFLKYTTNEIPLGQNLLKTPLSNYKFQTSRLVCYFVIHFSQL